MYKWLLLAHVIGGSVWFGGLVYVESLMAAAARSKDPTTIMTVAMKAGEVNKRIFAGAGLITLIFGVWIVLDGPLYDFENLFVTIGFAVAIVGLAIGVFIMAPRGKEIEELIAENGLTDPTAMAKAKKLGNLGHIQTLLVTIAFIAMVIKIGV